MHHQKDKSPPKNQVQSQRDQGQAQGQPLGEHIEHQEQSQGTTGKHKSAVTPPDVIPLPQHQIDTSDTELERRKQAVQQEQPL